MTIREILQRKATVTEQIAIGAIEIIIVGTVTIGLGITAVKFLWDQIIGGR